MSYVNKQASLLATTARTAEVSGLKQDLERTEGELGLVKRHLEESQGTQYLIYIFIKDRWFLLDRSIVNFYRGHDRSGGPEEGVDRG